jgi:hypothetical protein
MDIEGFTKLHDASLRQITTRGEVATLLAAVATKITTLGVIRDEIIKARLDNISKFLDIKWDVQAHKHLVKMRNLLLHHERLAREEWRQMKMHLFRVGTLLAGGGSWTSMRDAWVAFEFLRGHCPPSIIAKAGDVVPRKGAYRAGAWLHPNNRAVVITAQDPGSLIQWARHNTCYPITGGDAWRYLADYLETLEQACKAEAASIEIRIAAAQEEALELCKVDWDRLKQ